MIKHRKTNKQVMPNIYFIKPENPKKTMAFIRRKKVKGKKYYYIVESYKQKGKVKQRVLLYLGTANSLLKKLKKKETKS